MMIQMKIVEAKPQLSPECIRVVKVGVLSELIIIIVIAASLKQKTSFIIVIYSFISFFYIFFWCHPKGKKKALDDVPERLTAESPVSLVTRASNEDPHEGS